MIILGVDPGSRVTGYGLIDRQGDEIQYLNCGLIRPPPKAPFYERIHGIFHSLSDLMGQNRPVEMSLEDLFYAKNIQSSLKLGHARGAALIAAMECGVSIFEYSPLEIKKSVVGYGRADKEQVRAMVKTLLGMKEDPPLDASDALAAAICHAHFKRWGRRMETAEGERAIP